MTDSGDPSADLGRRERQIMDIVFRLGRATASQVHEGLADPPSYSSVRAMLRYLEDKGLLRHEEDGPRYVYMATIPKSEARSSALSHVVRTFFDGSVATAVAALIESRPLSREEHDRLSRLLAEAPKERN